MLTKIAFQQFVQEHGPVARDTKRRIYIAADTAQLAFDHPFEREPFPENSREWREVRQTYLTILRDEGRQAYTEAANELRAKLEECATTGCQIWFDLPAERQQVAALKRKLSLRQSALDQFLSPVKQSADADDREAEAARDRNRDTARQALESCADVLGG